PDTVGQPPGAEICVSNMPSLKAKKRRKPPQEKVLLELGRGLTNSIRPLFRQAGYGRRGSSLGVEQSILRISVRLAPLPQVFRHITLRWSSRFSSTLTSWLPTDGLHSLLAEKVLHTFADCVFHQFEPSMEVTHCLLTRGDMRSRMPLAFAHCTKREHPTEPILTEPHCRTRHPIPATLSGCWARCSCSGL